MGLGHVSGGFGFADSDQRHTLPVPAAVDAGLLNSLV
jgi:hypothetical protein